MSVLFTKLLEEYFRIEMHPEYWELCAKYPNLAEIPRVRSYWLSKYPSKRKTDEEYRKMWTDAFNAPSIFDHIRSRIGEKYSEPISLTIEPEE